MNTHQESDLKQSDKHWIDGERIGSSTVANSVSPSTGEVLGQYSAGGRVEAASAIAAARKAFNAGVWSHDPQLRSRALLELADRLVERTDAIALTISREEGKTLGEATLEATWSPATLRYNADLIRHRYIAAQVQGKSADIAGIAFVEVLDFRHSSSPHRLRANNRKVTSEGIPGGLSRDGTFESEDSG